VRFKRRLRCSQCGSLRLEIVEASEAYTVFQQGEDGDIEREGNNHHGGITGIVNVKCHTCGREWTPRGVRQITDVLGYPETP
jgi:hypothetical protein